MGDDPRTARPPVQALTTSQRLIAISIGDLWSPQTDGGVVAQVIVTLVVIAGLVWLARDEKSLVQLVVGVGMVVLAWYGLRTLH